MIDGQAFNSGLDHDGTGRRPSPRPTSIASQSNVYYANNSPVPLLEKPPSGWKGCVFNRYVDNATDDDDGDIRDGPFSGGGKDWPAWAPVLPGDYPDATIAASGAVSRSTAGATEDSREDVRGSGPARNARPARRSGSRRCNTTKR